MSQIATFARNNTLDARDSLNTNFTNVPLDETIGAWKYSADNYRFKDVERKRIKAALNFLDEVEISVDEQSKLIKESTDYDFMLPITKF